MKTTSTTVSPEAQTKPALKLVRLPLPEVEVEEVPEVERRLLRLPPESQYIVDDKEHKNRRGNIVAAKVLWLSVADGHVRQGQIWKVKDDGRHPKPLPDEVQLRFLAGFNNPTVVLDTRALSLSRFLRLVLRGDARYVRG